MDCPTSVPLKTEVGLWHSEGQSSVLGDTRTIKIGSPNNRRCRIPSTFVILNQDVEKARQRTFFPLKQFAGKWSSSSCLKLIGTEANLAFESTAR